MHELSILIITVLVLLNYAMVKDYAYPPFIFSVIWAIVLTAHYMASLSHVEDIYSLSDRVLVIFVAGVVASTLGGVLSYVMRGDLPLRSAQPTITTMKQAGYYDAALFYVPIVCLPFFVMRSFEIAAASGVDNFFLGLKLQQLDEMDIAGYGILRYVGMIAIFNAVYRVYVAKSDPHALYARLKYRVSFIVALTYSVFSLGRSIIVTLVVMVIGIRMIMKEIKIKDFVLALGFFVLIFVLIAIVLGKGGDVKFSFFENITGISDSMLKYYIGPLAAFDYFLHESYDLQYGEHSLRFFQAFLFKFGLASRPPVDLVNPFVFIPYPANVYTMYYPYVNDFGIMISFVFIGLFSFIHSMLYFRAYEGSFGAIMLYALFLYPLLMSTFQDQYLSLFSQWAQFGIMLLLTILLCADRPIPAKHLDDRRRYGEHQG